MSDNNIEWPEAWNPKEGWPGTTATSPDGVKLGEVDQELRKQGSSLEELCNRLGRPRSADNDTAVVESLVARKEARALREAQEDDMCVITDARGNVLFKAWHEWASTDEIEEPENRDAEYECMGCGLAWDEDEPPSGAMGGQR